MNSPFLRCTLRNKPSLTVKVSRLQYLPCYILKPFVKNYSVVTIDNDIVNEIFYPSGYIDFVVKISPGNAATIIKGVHRDTPELELLGHLTIPTRLNASKGTSVLIARLYPYATSIFFPNPISDFTNAATNLHDVYSNEVLDCYDLIMHTNSITRKIRILESFFIRQLKKREKQYRKIQEVAAVCKHIVDADDAFDINCLSTKFGFSKRYIQKQFYEMVGLTPGLLYATRRFNNGLQQVLSTDSHLTNIAYDCGYYDQAHFIKEFRRFTGISPSQARRTLVKNGDEFQKAVNIGI